VREVVARGAGVALAELRDGDIDWFRSNSDGAFDVERDDRPMPYKMPSYKIGITSEDGAELLGYITWHPVIYGPSYGCVAWNFGRELLPAARGKGVGTEALRLLIRHLFATTDVDRLEASTDVTNIPAQRSLEKAGLTREGIIRGAQLREGGRHDIVAYSILRSDVGLREIVARGKGFALAKMLDGDKDRLTELGDGAFDADRDDSPPPLDISRLAVTNEEGTELLGAVSWHAVGYGPSFGSRAWDIGAGLLPSARNSGIGTQLARVLAEYLVDTTDVHRVQASTDVTNKPAQRAMEKAGFIREGVIRGAQLRGGEHRDMVGYSLLRTDVTGEKLTAGQNGSAELTSGDA
jgi:RimJ/RimL family protein N-acetyltransferase